MNRPTLSLAVVCTLCVGLGQAQQAPLRSGIDRTSFDTSVRPQDDFFRYVNGGWLKSKTIPADRTSLGSFADLREEADKQIKVLIEEASKSPNRTPGSEAQQIGDLYASYLNASRIAQLGASPIKPELDKIDAVKTTAELARRIGELAAFGVGGMDLTVGPDATVPGTTILGVGQTGILLLPNRDYYVRDDPKLADTRAAYQAYLETIFKLVDRPSPAADAKAVAALETELARAQWTAAELRDPVKRYNKYTFAQLAAEMPDFDWAAWAKAQGFDTTSPVNVAQPSFFRTYAALVTSTPLPAWKAWLAAQLISKEAAYLSQPFVDAQFSFFDRTLRGQEVLRSREDRAVAYVNTSLGEAVGSLYVKKHFPPQAKVRMQQMVANLIEAYRQSISSVEWMTPDTRAKALDKLSKFLPQIAYPDKWRSYQGLVIKADDLAGNAMRIARFNRDESRAKLGHPPDRTEWSMTPQTVNAYYAPPFNKIVFPAAILQPPFFQLDADDAVNYGGIGAVIGHEIGHGFDDSGRRYDGTGALHDWWLPADDQEFRKRADRLVAQYDAYTPLPGFHVNGRLTLGENIGDLSGLGIAFKAYQISLKGQPSPVIDGFTGEQRVFLGFGQIWRGKQRDEALRVQVLSNPHSPSEYRANGPVSNIDAFYAAFNVGPTDKMFRKPEERVRIW